MFISRASYDKALVDARNLGNSETAAFYEMRIKDLYSQIEDLRKLIFIPMREPSKEVYEVDAIISASEKPVEQSEAERNAYLEGARELDLLVSGNYDQDLMQ